MTELERISSMELSLDLMSDEIETQRSELATLRNILVQIRDITEEGATIEASSETNKN